MRTHLGLPAGLFVHEQAGGDDAALVHDQERVRGEQGRQVQEAAVVDA